MKADLNANAIRLAHRVEKQLNPLVRHETHRPRTLVGDRKNERALNPVFRHRLHVGRDSFAADVSVKPEPVGLGACGHRRLAECVLKRTRHQQRSSAYNNREPMQ